MAYPVRTELVEVLCAGHQGSLRQDQPERVRDGHSRSYFEPNPDLIAEALGQPVIHDRDLEEWRRGGGTLDGDAFMTQFRSLAERRRPFHRYADGCETGLEFSTRVHAALDRIVTQYLGKTVMLMTHGGVIQVAFQFFFAYGDAAFRRAYPAASHTSITLWRKEAGSERWALEFANDRHHL